MTLPRSIAFLFLIAGMGLVGTYVALSKPLTAVFPVFLLATLRFAIAAVAMLPWTRRRPDERPIGRSEWKALFLQSLFGNFLFSICMLTGVSLTSATAAGVILSTLPAVVALFSRVFLGERLTPRALAAIGLAIAGIAVLQLSRGTGAGGAGASSLAGNLLVFGSVCCEAVYVILGKRLTATLAPMRISALINLWGFALMLPLGLWQGAGFAFGAVTPAIWGLLVFYALSASMISAWLWLTGLKSVPASNAGVFSVALPIASSIVGVAVLGERFSLAHGIALACAAGGIVLISLPGRRTAGSPVKRPAGAGPSSP